MRRESGPPHAHPKEVVVVKLAFVPIGLLSRGEAYLVRTWLLELGERYIHTCTQTMCTRQSPTPETRYVCNMDFVITHSSTGSVSNRTCISIGFFHSYR